MEREKTINAGKANQYFKAWSQRGYVKDAFDYWAKKFRTRLDGIHGKKKAEEKT